MLKHAWGSKRPSKKTVIIVENNVVVNTIQATLKQRLHLHDLLTKRGFVRTSQDRDSRTYSK